MKTSASRLCLPSPCGRHVSFARSQIHFNFNSAPRRPRSCIFSSSGGGDSADDKLAPTGPSTIAALTEMLGGEDDAPAADADADADATTAEPYAPPPTESENGEFVHAPLIRRPSPAPAEGMPAGEYVALALRFPNLATSNQRTQEQRGVSLDFVLDTGSSADIVLPPVAQELQLEEVGEQPAGAGALGAGLQSGKIVMLGDTQLDYLPPDRRFAFITGFNAAALFVPTPGVAGILGKPFFDSFDAIDVRVNAGTGNHTALFHAAFDADAAMAESGLRRIAVDASGPGGLPIVMVSVNGGPPMRGLLDTGAPITILNRAAADAAGVTLMADADAAPPSAPPTGGLLSMFQSPPPPPKPERGAAWVGGAGGVAPIRLVASEHAVAVAADGVQLANVPVLVGDLPGFAALGAGEDEPAVLLGWDALRGGGGTARRIVFGTRRGFLLA